MISTFQKLVEDLVLKSLLDITEFRETYPGLHHGPTLGDMYEDITRKALNASLLESFDLKVVDGFIQWDEKSFSSQQDAMIVSGNGVRIPGTNRTVFQAKNVIATVEVKKTLSRKKLLESLVKFRTLSEDHFNRFTFDDDSPLFDGYARIYNHACKYILRRSLPLSPEPTDYSCLDSIASKTIACNSVTPLKIIWGFDGFKTEHGLAQAFVELGQDMLADETFNGTGDLVGRLNWFPDLIISSDASIVRTNGMPFGSPSKIDNAFCLYGSHHTNPVSCLLNILWYRIVLLTSTQGFSYIGNGQIPVFKEQVAVVPAKSPIGGVGQPVQLLFQNDFSWKRDALLDYTQSPVQKTGPIPFVTLQYAGSAENKADGIDLSDRQHFLVGLRSRVKNLRSEYFDSFMTHYDHQEFDRALESTFEECIAELLATKLFYITNNRLYTCAAHPVQSITADTGQITIGDARFGGIGQWWYQAFMSSAESSTHSTRRGNRI